MAAQKPFVVAKGDVKSGVGLHGKIRCPSEDTLTLTRFEEYARRKLCLEQSLAAFGQIQAADPLPP